MNRTSPAAGSTGNEVVEEHRESDLEVEGRVTAGYTWPQVFARIEGGMKGRSCGENRLRGRL